MPDDADTRKQNMIYNINIMQMANPKIFTEKTPEELIVHNISVGIEKKKKIHFAYLMYMKNRFFRKLSISSGFSNYTNNTKYIIISISIIQLYET